MTTATAAAIRVHGLKKSFNDLDVLRGVDFDVPRSTIFALLGSNGAGKTTVIRILSTLLSADAGTAGVGDFDVATTQPQRVRESISLTGQFAAVDEVLTGRENLVLVARLRHVKDPGRVADDLLARFSLTDAATRPSSSSTSRRRGSTRRHVWRCGMPSPSSPGPAQPYSSRRRTWTRPSISPTG